MERIQTGSGFRQTVDIVDTDGKGIQRIQADNGYRGYMRTVDTEKQ